MSSAGPSTDLWGTRIWAALGLTVGIVAFKGLIEYSYLAYVVPLFGYMGLGLSYSAVKHFESYLWLVGLLLVTPAKVRKPSDFLLFVYLMSVLVPVLAFYGMNDGSRWVVAMMAGAYLLTALLRGDRRLGLVRLRIDSRLLTWLVIGVATITIVAMIAVGGLGSFNLNPFEVYEVRLENNERFGGWLGYLVSWVTKAIVPFLLLVAALRRNWLFVAALLCVQLSLYGMTSHKAVAIYPLIALGTYILLSSRYPMQRLAALSGVGVLVAIFAVEFFDQPVLVSWFVRRAFFVPAFLNFSYVEFFSHNPWVFFSNSVLEGIVVYPYDEPYQRVIGRYAFTSNPPPWANAGFLATGYMHAGVVGVTFYTLLVCAALRFVDGLSTKTGLSVTTGAVIVPFLIVFTTADLPTAVLTHGLGLSLVLVWLLRSRGHHVGDGISGRLRRP